MIYYIVNPVAGSGRAYAKLKEIERQTQSKFRVLLTNAPMDAKSLAKRAIDEGATTIVAVGGDGTIHETVSGIVGSDVLFGVVPCGSGNDFVKSLGFSEKLSTAEYLRIIESGKPHATDLIKMGNFYFANIGSVGIDAMIVKTSSRFKKRLKGFSYIAATLQCVLTYDPIEMSIKIDGTELNRKFTLAAVCNGWNYGGGFKIAPSARNDDGRITLCLIERMPRLAMSTLFPSILVAKHSGLKEVSFIDCKEVVINYSGVQLVNLDGNLYELRGPLEFSVLPGALNILYDV